MGLKKIELTEKSGYTMEFSITREVYNKAELAVYKKEVGRISVPGFRKGKAPKHIIERMYGKGVFFEDAINDCIPDAFDEAVKEAGIEPVGNPKFDLVSMEDGEDIVLKAEGFVKPEISIENYKGIEAEKKSVSVSDAEVDAEVDRARERNARSVEVTDRAVADGDIANIDYEGFVDGKAFDGGKGEKHDLKIGSGSFIPGFEDQIVGKNVGDEFDVNVTFPLEYHAKELAGKDATFKVKLNAIKVEELPAADDEFAKDVSDFETFAEYKADLKAKMTEQAESRADRDFENAIAEKLGEMIVGDVPEVMYDEEANNIVRDFDARLRSQGMDLATYMKYTGMTADALRAQYRPQAEKQVRIRLALEKIAALENIQISDEEVEAEFKRIGEAYGVALDQVKKMLRPEDVRKDLAVGAAMKIVKENAKATTPAEEKPKAKKATKAKAPKAEAAEKPADEEPKAEKKPAAKKTTKAKKTESAE